jgi:dTDP-4-amino-4,6-dideoxygalactose transaminase
MQLLLDRGVATRRGIMCVHREAPYAKPVPRAALVESERAQDHCVLLPLYHELTEADQDYVIDQLGEVAALPATV